jgi:3',5'-cyclic-AMP phosphodiesterase
VPDTPASATAAPGERAAGFLVAQISDLHVRAPGQLYKDVADSNRMLGEAIDHLLRLDRRPDLVLVTGDLVDEGRPEEYANAVALLARLQLPCLVMPGNHDRRDEFRRAFAGHHRYLPAHGPLHYCVDEHPLRVVALDSCPPGKHHGSVDEAGMDWLAATLAADTVKPTLLLLHHPPFVSGIGYLDEYRYLEADALERLVGRFSNVQAVLCGHVHRVMMRRWAGTMVVACPSTTTEIALQLAPQASPQSFMGPPACLLHLWQPPHGLITHVSYIGQFDGPYPFF